jgi:hypothetical protein
MEGELNYPHAGFDLLVLFGYCLHSLGYSNILDEYFKRYHTILSRQKEIGI